MPQIASPRNAGHKGRAGKKRFQSRHHFLPRSESVRARQVRRKRRNKFEWRTRANQALECLKEALVRECVDRWIATGCKPRMIRSRRSFVKHIHRHNIRTEHLACTAADVLDQTRSMIQLTLVFKHWDSEGLRGDLYYDAVNFEDLCNEVADRYQRAAAA